MSYPGIISIKVRNYSLPKCLLALAELIAPITLRIGSLPEAKVSCKEMWFRKSHLEDKIMVNYNHERRLPHIYERRIPTVRFAKAPLSTLKPPRPMSFNGIDPCVPKPISGSCEKMGEPEGFL